MQLKPTRANKKQNKATFIAKLTKKKYCQRVTHVRYLLNSQKRSREKQTEKNPKSHKSFKPILS